MLIICNHCYTEQEARVSKEKPHKILCQKCGKVVDNINNFMINSLVAQKKFVTEEKGGFSFHCTSCNGVHKAVLVKTSEGNWAKCTNCEAKVENVSDFMLRQMNSLTIIDETT